MVEKKYIGNLPTATKITGANLVGVDSTGKAKLFGSDLLTIRVKDLATAATYNFSGIDSVIVEQYTSASPNAPALYSKVTSQPSHSMKFQSADGIWFEISGKEFDIRSFGAVGNCPDVSGISPTSQSSIIAQVTGAINDLEAFKRALIVCKYKNGGTIVLTKGAGQTGIYRLAYNSTISGLGVPSNTTIIAKDGARIEIDPSLAPNWATLPPTGITGRLRITGGIGFGDPEDSTRSTPTDFALSTLPWIFPAGTVTASMFTHNVKFENLDLRQHIRTNWRQYASGDGTYRSYGIYGFFGVECSVINCRFEGTSNDGLNLFGGWNNSIINTKAIKCGYGAQFSSAQNGISVYGVQIVGSPEFSTRGNVILNAYTFANKDEGIAIGPQGSLLVQNAVCIGDHDRAIEGMYGQSTGTSATIGEEILNDVIVENVYHDGFHQVGTGTVSSGALTQLVMTDAFYVHKNDESTDRYIFIEGAGPGGNDGPFVVSAVNYTTNTVTLGSAVTTPVTNAVCYIMSARSITPEAGNDCKATLKTARIKNVYASSHPISFFVSNGGKATVEDIIAENVTVVSNFSLVASTCEDTTIDNVKIFNSTSSGTGGSLISVNSTGVKRARIRNVEARGSFTYSITVGNTTNPMETIDLDNVLIGDSKQISIRLIIGSSLNLLKVKNVTSLGGNTLNGTGVSNGTFLGIQASNTPSINMIEITNCKSRQAFPANYPILVADGTIAASGIGHMIIENNDWGLSEFYQPGTYPVSFDNSGNIVVTLFDRNNKMYGQREVYASAVPTSGTFGRGDFIRNQAPTASGPYAWICVTPGTFGAISGGTTVASSSTGRDVTLTSVTGIVPGSVLVIAGTPRKVVKISGSVITMPTAVSISSGAVVTNQEPVLKAINLVA